MNDVTRTSKKLTTAHVHYESLERQPDDEGRSVRMYDADEVDAEIERLERDRDHWRSERELWHTAAMDAQSYAGQLRAQLSKLRASPEPPLECAGCEEFVRMQHDIASLLGVDEDTDSISLHDRIYGALSQGAGQPPAPDTDRYQWLKEHAEVVFFKEYVWVDVSPGRKIHVRQVHPLDLDTTIDNACSRPTKEV